MSKLTYIRCGDYDIPNLKLSVLPETSIGKYGRMRKSYLKEHRPILYNQLLMSEKLYGNLTGMTGTAPKYRKLRRICETPCWIHTPTFWKIRLPEMTAI